MLLPPTTDLYPHAFNSWRQTEASTAADGKPALNLTWTAVYTSQACYFETGPGTDALNEGLIQSERDQIFTLDVLRVPDTVAMQSGDVIKQTSGPEVGVYFRIRGDNRYRSQFGEFIRVYMSRLEAAPSGVS